MVLAGAGRWHDRAEFNLRQRQSSAQPSYLQNIGAEFALVGEGFTYESNVTVVRHIGVKLLTPLQLEEELVLNSPEVVDWHTVAVFQTVGRVFNDDLVQVFLVDVDEVTLLQVLRQVHVLIEYLNVLVAGQTLGPARDTGQHLVLALREHRDEAGQDLAELVVEFERVNKEPDDWSLLVIGGHEP